MSIQQIVLGVGLLAAASIAVAEPVKAGKAPIRLTEAQMEKIVAGKPELQTLGESDNSCNSGKCFYTNNGHVIGKPVKGYNN